MSGQVMSGLDSARSVFGALLSMWSRPVPVLEPITASIKD